MTDESAPTAELCTLHGDIELAARLHEMAERVERGEIVYVTTAYLTYDGRVLFLKDGCARDGYDYLKLLGTLDVMQSGVRAEIQDLMSPEDEESV